MLEPEENRVEVVVDEQQLSLAIGRRGQNVRLASQLTGWTIDILTESEESERRQKEFTARTQLFMSALDLDEMMAQLLASEGFESIEDIDFVPVDELAVIDGLNEEIAQELQARAREYLDARAAEQDARRRELGVSDEVVALSNVTLPMAVKLGEEGYKSLEDVAGLVPDDLRGWFETKNGERVREPGVLESFNLTPQQAEALIMEARVAAGWVEPAAEEAEAEAALGDA